MSSARTGPGFYLFGFICLLVGLLLSIFPLPSEYAILRPEWLCLLVIYWVLSFPHHTGVVTAWGVGLLQDIVHGGVWGAHALALSVIAYVCLVSYQRLRSYSVWQQTLWVFVFVGIHQVTVNWLQGLYGYHRPTHVILLSTAVSAICWPLLYMVLRRLRKRYRIYAT